MRYFSKNVKITLILLTIPEFYPDCIIFTVVSCRNLIFAAKIKV